MANSSPKKGKPKCKKDHFIRFTGNTSYENSYPPPRKLKIRQD